LPSKAVALCKTCGRPLRLTGIEPHERAIGIDVDHFTCECGATESHLVARMD
jgi:hypothetical protein